MSPRSDHPQMRKAGTPSLPVLLASPTRGQRHCALRGLRNDSLGRTDPGNLVVALSLELSGLTLEVWCGQLTADGLLSLGRLGWPHAECCVRGL